MNISVISRNIGVALVCNALFMFICTVVAALYDFDSAFSPLLLSGIITITVGLFPLIFVKANREIDIKNGFIIIVLSWLLCCLFGMLPYVLWGGEFNLVNAWFESVSGYTTTGATILNNIEALPHSLLLWRSSTHFLGGIGIVIFMLYILPSVGINRARITKMEISVLSRENYRFKIKETIKRIATVYFGITFLSMVGFMLAGMNLFDAVNHAFSVVSTGGFSTKNLSIGAYDSVAVEMVANIFMLAASLHFGLIYALVVKGSFNLFKSPVIRFYIAVVTIATIIIAFNLLLSQNADSIWGALRLALFQVVSIASTTGFATADTSVWPNLSILILIYLSIQCGCSGSTSGGIKSDRILIFFKSLPVQLKKVLHPKAVLHVRLGDSLISHTMVADITMYMLIYMLILFVCALLLCIMGVDFMDSFTSSIASIGNVGPGFGNVGSYGNFSSIPAMGRVVVSVEMLLGRLEIYSLIIVLLISKWK